MRDECSAEMRPQCARPRLQSATTKLAAARFEATDDAREPSFLVPNG